MEYWECFLFRLAQPKYITPIMSTHPHDAVTAALLVPFFAAYVYSAIDAPIAASYLNHTYNLGKKKKEFSSLHINPDLINAGTYNKFDAGFSLVLR